MLHQMKLQEGPFEKVKKGTKILELRLFDEKRRLLKIGDEIEFSKLPELKEKVAVRVIGLLIYERFADLIQDLPASYLEYEESDKEYLKGSMYEVYTKEEEEKYGALGIRMKLI
jgi:ASC-1-like (ASCH) protein